MRKRRRGRRRRRRRRRKKEEEEEEKEEEEGDKEEEKLSSLAITTVFSLKSAPFQKAPPPLLFVDVSLFQRDLDKNIE